MVFMIVVHDDRGVPDKSLARNSSFLGWIECSRDDANSRKAVPRKVIHAHALSSRAKTVRPPIVALVV